MIGAKPTTTVSARSCATSHATGSSATRSTLEIEELRRLVQEGIDRGPGVDAEEVFARLRARFSQPLST